MFTLLDEPLPGEVAEAIATRMVKRRKEHNLSQVALSQASGVSLGSLRRFEQTHEISLASLIAIAFALGCESEFDALFATPHYDTIEDVMAAAERSHA